MTAVVDIFSTTAFGSPVRSTLSGLKVHADKAGKDAQLKLTDPAKPFTGVNVSVTSDVVRPALIVADDWDAAIVNAGVPVTCSFRFWVTVNPAYDVSVAEN